MIQNIRTHQLEHFHSLKAPLGKLKSEKCEIHFRVNYCYPLVMLIKTNNIGDTSNYLK